MDIIMKKNATAEHVQRAVSTVAQSSAVAQTVVKDESALAAAVDAATEKAIEVVAKEEQIAQPALTASEIGQIVYKNLHALKKCKDIRWHPFSAYQDADKLAKVKRSFEIKSVIAKNMNKKLVIYYKQKLTNDWKNGLIAQGIEIIEEL